MLGHDLKQFVDALIVFYASGIVKQFGGIKIMLCLGGQVRLVTHDYYWSSKANVVHEILSPEFNTFERVIICQVKD